jgi:hypothetical protein
MELHSILIIPQRGREAGGYLYGLLAGTGRSAALEHIHHFGFFDFGLTPQVLERYLELGWM